MFFGHEILENLHEFLAEFPRFDLVETTPFEKYANVKLDDFPQVEINIKDISNHYLVIWWTKN